MAFKRSEWDHADPSRSRVAPANHILLSNRKTRRPFTVAGCGETTSTSLARIALPVLLDGKAELGVALYRADPARLIFPFTTQPLAALLIAIQLTSEAIPATSNKSCMSRRLWP
ncbi:hypothetical protein ATY81_16665 [Rhizobium sp. R72]|nr:hypothetical protein ATY81_16665 [Rhizobium sp. R72]OWV92994.1 hypothetical protein ATY80_16665 [Rhizobium sp. R711]